MVLQVHPIQKEPTVTWEPLPADFILPDDPVENIQQPSLAAALTDALGSSGRIQPQMLIGSNFGLVATVNKKIVVKAPDWLYVPQVQPVAADVIRRSYTPNLEGAAVAVVMEFLSDTEGGELSVRSSPPYGKLYFYEQILKVPTYVTYDPYEPSLEVRCLQNGQYNLQQADVNGRFWIPELELFLGNWQGERLCKTMNWLRWWDREENLLLWSSEQAEQERQRAEQERQRAEQERQRAEQEHQRAEQEHQRAEQERQRADILAAKLRELNIDPDAIA
ncbi:Uma2 family endonuclease [aff. Roholtiella sp. LEGE 12411]|uniref:Uma2 family endonuclease n=1 Tax=aff. Roholtiella sp. LEGE 12411 TaxID=1828822 RepID=UPI001882B61D|nr:Uma2 family endonuclease [aff. Roholtiella sp. LEGE 12411]MBE9036077.1 Uma2 family endonuclease [aff. Roholtiella sp. LEGE 12411]